MSKIILTDASLTVNAVDLSNHIDTIVINMTADDIDLTSMGATSHQHAPGLRDDSMDVTFFQDYAASSVDATLSALLGNSVGVVIVAKPTSAAVSSTNPTYTFTGILLDYTPINGQVGQASKNPVKFMCAQNSSLVRATS